MDRTIARLDGEAGRSARDGYREELGSRRRAFARCSVAAVVAAGLAWVAVCSAGDTRRAAAGGAVAALLYALWRRPKPDPQRWLRGSAGEIATARMLDRLPERKWAVMHDLGVPGSRSNIDHLVIGPTGVWVIDTKTTRGGARRVIGGVRLGNRRLDTGPVRFEGSVVEDRLGTRTRTAVAVHCVGLRRRGVRSGGVRVVPADALVDLVARRAWAPWRRRLGRSEVHRLARLAESQFPPAGCSGRTGGWYR